MNIKKYINDELLEFKNHHKNKYNVIIHIISGIIYMSCLSILLFKNKFLLFYLLLLIFTFNNIFISLLTIFTIYCCNIITLNLTNNNYVITMILLLFCFIVPEISHIITNESTQLNFQNLTSLKLITNILYFLPFSLYILFNSSDTI
jgi:hypothetical protein